MQITLDYNMRTYLPFVTNQLSMQTVLLIVVVMSVLRGAFKRSISAFRLGGVASLLAVIVQWPPIAGNLETMKFEELWWWDDQKTCNEFHSGKPYFDPKEHGPYGSEAYCEDSRWAVGGAFVTFVALHLNMVACAVVYRQNQSRESLVVMSDQDAAALNPGAFGFGPSGPEDPFSFNAATRGGRSKAGSAGGEGAAGSDTMPMSV